MSFSSGDRVIFSSRAIPGNEKAVMRVINGLVARGVEVITDRDHLVHVSGHPRRAELQDMIGWVRPQILIPAHGETLHMAAHAALARRAGVPKVITCRDGDLVRLAPQPGIVGEVPAGRLYKDGSILIGAQERPVADRRRLGFAGIVSVAVTLSQQGELVSGPRLELTGIPEADSAGTPMLQIAEESVAGAFNSMPQAAPARPRCGRRGAAARGALGHRHGLEEEAHMPRPRADGMMSAVPIA